VMGLCRIVWWRERIPHRSEIVFTGGDALSRKGRGHINEHPRCNRSINIAGALPGSQAGEVK